MIPRAYDGGLEGRKEDTVAVEVCREGAKCGLVSQGLHQINVVP